MKKNSATNGGGAVNVSAGTFTISGSAYIPYGGSEHNNDVYLAQTNPKITIGGALSGHDSLSKIYLKMPVDKYTPASPVTVLEVTDSPDPNTSVLQEYEKFAIIDNDTTDAYDWLVDNQGKARGRIGEKWAPDSKDDIVFIDGSATAYTETLSLSPAKKAKAMAVVFYKGAEYNDDADGTDEKLIAVGLKQSDAVMWAANGTTMQRMKGNNTSMSANLNGATNTIVFYDTASDQPVSDWDTYYPAWNFIKTYGSTYCSGSSYTIAWYMPSVYELQKIRDDKTTINAVLSLTENTVLSGYYWSSTKQSGNVTTVNRLPMAGSGNMLVETTSTEQKCIACYRF